MLLKTNNNQINRWMLPKPINNNEIKNCVINSTLQKVMCRRGINLDADLVDFIKPSELPNPEDHFQDLNKATLRIIEACKKNEKVAICGDYDADGITSTVLLVELLNKLGANTFSYIPSRQDDGYGLNIKMINDINRNEIKLIITVDNGVSAFCAIKRAKEFDIDLIITDHHKLPDNKLDIYALIHPERSPNNSPYKYLAGVGIAYMLANNICKNLEFDLSSTSADVLFCIGTVADMAPLVGANRKWLKDCLPKIKSTVNPAIKIILKKLYIDDIDISSDDIGYKIAPLINAVGRIGDPNIVIDLLTNSSIKSINQLTKDCFAINKERKKLTELVEKEALVIATNEFNKNRKFLVISKKEWHPGIIGIVAAKIVDKFNLPTAILSIADDGIFRGSIRSNSKLKVNQALNECKDLLLAYGGHSAAAGFTVKEENISLLKEKLNNIAIREFKNCNLDKSINPDAYLHLRDINNDFYRELKLLGPFGTLNKAPLFWTRKCRVVNIYQLKGNHAKMILDDGTGIIDAIKWNYSSNLKINELIDVAFHVEINRWKKIKNLQLNIIDIKKYHKVIDLQLHKRIYKCQISNDKRIQITNSQGLFLSSDLANFSNKTNECQDKFAEKILTFAEIALGRTA